LPEDRKIAWIFAVFNEWRLRFHPHAGASRGLLMHSIRGNQQLLWLGRVDLFRPSRRKKRGGVSRAEVALTRRCAQSPRLQDGDATRA
jgi:hypothetical protein